MTILKRVAVPLAQLSRILNMHEGVEVAAVRQEGDLAVLTVADPLGRMPGEDYAAAVMEADGYTVVSFRDAVPCPGKGGMRG